MKKLIFYTSIISTAALLFSCAKEIETSTEAPEEVAPVEETFEYVFRISDDEEGESI